MKIVAALVLMLLALPTSVPAQAVRVIAVADFADETGQGILINAARLSGDLQVYLTQQAGGRFRVVAVDEVRAAMRARGYAPTDLISPTRSGQIAQAVGADWFITGRWVYLDTDHEPGMLASSVAQATIEIRVLEASTRRVILTDTFSGTGFGATNTFLLRLAALAALRQAAARISRL